MTLYEALGIDKNATQAEIKKAFRKRVKETHPDIGGSKEEFYQVNKAFHVLSDLLRRQQYDETGECSDSGVSREQDLKDKAVSTLAAAFHTYLMNDNVMRIDIKSSVAMNLNQRKHDADQQIRKLKRKLETMDEIKNRTSYTGNGHNLIAGIVEGETRGLKMLIQQQKESKEVITRAEELLKDYSFRFDQSISDIKIDSYTISYDWGTEL